MINRITAVSFCLTILAVGLASAALINSSKFTSAPTPRNEIETNLIAELEALRLELRQHKVDAERFKNNLEFRLEAGEWSGLRKNVDLDPASRQYCRIDAPNGFFLISCQECQPFLDGQKLILRIGNPLNVSYIGFKINMQWGIRFAGDKNSDSQEVMKWYKTLKSKEFSFADTLYGGKWNEIEVILPDTPSNSLGYLNVSLSTNAISLSIPTKKP